MKEFLRFYTETKYECDPYFPVFTVDVVVDGRGVIGVWTIRAKKREYNPIIRNAMLQLPQLCND